MLDTAIDDRTRAEPPNPKPDEILSVLEGGDSTTPSRKCTIEDCGQTKNSLKKMFNKEQRLANGFSRDYEDEKDRRIEREKKLKFRIDTLQEQLAESDGNVESLEMEVGKAEEGSSATKKTNGISGKGKYPGMKPSEVEASVILSQARAQTKLLIEADENSSSEVLRLIIVVSAWKNLLDDCFIYLFHHY